MTQPTFDFSTLFETYKTAMAPVFRAQQEGLKTLERLAHYQFAVAGDYLEWSLAQASLLNDAYRTLKNPLERTKYLLKLEGVQFEEDRGAGNLNPSKVPADLLEEVFELNMQLEELRQNQKLGEDDPQLRRDLEAAKNQFAAQLSALDEQVRSRWSAWDAAWEQNDEAKKTAAKEAMTSLLQRRSYLKNLVRDVEQTLGES